ncbi:DUF2790 domain-containing protein [Pseudomonas botevensis]|uniref:DUF2790 domain-containing protein n=1 Tax=Pseudomonas botevensis TaxID=2842352 RepID=UPI001C3C6386|nr:DUF2790 domain-containing protein [Pseudomonas botevensis]MBV4475960.1 DUF2790 domain-containing protein [Pseudomonas botevensis]
MNIRPFLLTIAIICTAFTGLAQANDSTTTSKAVPYEYGMPLHVAKVISMSEPQTQQCKVITADMKYIDNTGKPEEISYRKMSDACDFQN